MLALFELRQEPLRECDESIRSSGEQSAVDVRIIMKRTALQRRHEPILTPHVVADRIINVAARGEITHFSLNVHADYFSQKS
jgi:hypothetical protein